MYLFQNQKEFLLAPIFVLLLGFETCKWEMKEKKIEKLTKFFSVLNFYLIFSKKSLHPDAKGLSEPSKIHLDTSLL